LEYTTGSQNLYPNPIGLVIVFDLAYNYHSAFGNYFPGLRELVLQASNKLIKVNPNLHVLRERVKKAL